MNGKLNETIEVSALWSTMQALCVWDTNMLVSQKPGRPNAKPGKGQRDPQHEQVEYTSRWAISRWYRIGHDKISCCLCQFCSRWVGVNVASGGIWALDIEIK